jgi:hypothetical protein
MYLTRLAAWLSQGVNCVLLAGHQDQTVSARCYVNKHRHVWAFARDAINLLFFWQPDHCQASYQRDIDFAKELLNNSNRR